MRILPFILIVALVQAAVTSFPHAAITGGGIEATVYLPDTAAGYYRGTRFDWSGAVGRLRWNNHEFFGEWFARHDPLLHDGITGPVEEFLTGDSSVGYDEATTGEAFIRIGVGAVRKPREPAYRRFATYEIVDPGKWNVSRGKDRVTYTHTLRETNGYGYVYTKVLRLAKDALVLEHRLKNTGAKPIVTSVYNHNFFTIDNRPTGPDVVVRFGFEPRAMRPLGEPGVLSGRELTFARELTTGQSVFTELDGFGPTAADYDVRVENRTTRAGVRVTADRPISKFVFWSAPRTVCPEPYIDASVASADETTWRITYQFYSLP